MKPAFWDTSSLVPLCVQQAPSVLLRDLFQQHALVVWWGAPVEMRSAVERLRRIGQISGAEYTVAEERMKELRSLWREIQPGDSLRLDAEQLLRSYPLRAADALQLAAARAWSSGAEREHTFIAGDRQLLEAARAIGFVVVPSLANAG